MVVRDRKSISRVPHCSQCPAVGLSALHHPAASSPPPPLHLHTRCNYRRSVALLSFSPSVRFQKRPGRLQCADSADARPSGTFSSLFKIQRPKKKKKRRSLHLPPLPVPTPTRRFFFSLSSPHSSLASSFLDLSIRWAT